MGDRAIYCPALTDPELVVLYLEPIRNVRAARFVVVAVRDMKRGAPEVKPFYLGMSTSERLDVYNIEMENAYAERFVIPKARLYGRLRRGFGCCQATLLLHNPGGHAHTFKDMVFRGLTPEAAYYILIKKHLDPLIL